MARRGPRRGLYYALPESATFSQLLFRGPAARGLAVCGWLHGDSAQF